MLSAHLLPRLCKRSFVPRPKAEERATGPFNPDLHALGHHSALSANPNNLRTGAISMRPATTMLDGEEDKSFTLIVHRTLHRTKFVSHTSPRNLTNLSTCQLPITTSLRCPNSPFHLSTRSMPPTMQFPPWLRRFPSSATTHYFP